MSIETLSRDQTPLTTRDDGNFYVPPRNDLTPEGDDDDLPHIKAAIAHLEDMLAMATENPGSESTSDSLVSGWEARARDAQPGKGYGFNERPARSVDIRRGIGRYAVDFRPNMGRQSFGMPERMSRQTCIQMGRQAIARF